VGVLLGLHAERDNNGKHQDHGHDVKATHDQASCLRVGAALHADRRASSVPAPRSRNFKRFRERESNTSLRCGKMGESVALDFGSLAPQAELAA
jgi:hypothetical protein